MSARLTLLILTLAALPSGARAEGLQIEIDGGVDDWAPSQNCTVPAAGGGFSIPLDLVCIENDSREGQPGHLFARYRTSSSFTSWLNKLLEQYYGFAYDKDGDGQLTEADEVYAIRFLGVGFFDPATVRPSHLNVYSFSAANDYTTPLRSYAYRDGQSQCAFDGYRSSRNVELSVSFDCLGLPAGGDTRLFMLGSYPNFNLSPTVNYDAVTSSISPASTVDSEVLGLVAISSDRSNRLVWTNPPGHTGVLILRSEAEPVGEPSPQAYAVGATIGNSKVVYVDKLSSVSSFVDGEVVNGRTYYYRVYNHRVAYQYQPATVRVLSEPTSRAAPSALWCYSTGVVNLMQPTTELGAAVFSADGQGGVYAARTDAGGQGGERWRPVAMDGAVQARMFPVTLEGGLKLIAVDQQGGVARIDAATGTREWRTQVGAYVLAPVAVQLKAYSNSGFSHATDMIYVAASNDNQTYRVYGLRATDGDVTLTSNATMGRVSGGMGLDYSRNRLWVASKTRSNRSIQLVNTSSGAVTYPNGNGFGDIDTGVNFDYDPAVGAWTQAVVINTAGVARGFDLSTLRQVWSVALGSAPATFAYTTGGGFISVLKSGRINRYAVTGSTVAPLWSNPATISGFPSAIAIDYNAPSYSNQKIFVGGGDGRLYQLRLSDGVIEKSPQILAQAVALGDPAIDAMVRRLHFGTMDGRLCAVQLPLP